jgi:hypothetical protein
MLYKEYPYTSIDTLLAEVKEEMKSYFEAGAVTEMMVPTYVEQCLRKLKTAALKPEEAILFIEDYKGTLPPDFHLLNYAISYDRRADRNLNIGPGIPSTVGYYSKDISCEGGDCALPGACDSRYQVFEKITCQTNQNVRYVMTRPQWIRVYYGSRDLCITGCRNLSVRADDIIVIHEHKGVTATFEKGCIYIGYFSKPVDEQTGLPLIPEVLEVEEYVKSHLKFKLFEQLWNSVVDETFNQIQSKLQYYKQDSLSKLQAAIGVLRQRTRQQVNDDIVRQRNRFSKYNIS